MGHPSLGRQVSELVTEVAGKESRTIAEVRVALVAWPLLLYSGDSAV